MEDYSLRRQSHPKRYKALFVFITFLCIILFICTGLITTFFKTHTSSVSPIAQSIPTPPSPPQDTQLEQVILSALDGTHGSYGISIKNLRASDTYTMNENKVYKSGSLYKLWIMATVYQQIQKGILKENQILTENVVTLNKQFALNPNTAEKKDGKITFSVKEGLYEMITISDNYAALLLAQKVKLSTVATFLKNNGLTQSRVGVDGKDPVTTAHDIALFFDLLYNGKLANATYTNDMIDLLKQQKLNEKLPKYLPEEIVMAHKTGELDSFTHDAGIVYTPYGNYILVVLSDTDDTDAANERLSEISKQVYNYFAQ